MTLLFMKAIAKQVRMSPRKVRLVVDSIRGLSIDEALMVLSSMQKRAAAPVIKTIESAVANAVTNNGSDRANLFVSSITVDEGQAMKRFHPSSRGRVHPYKKRGSHIKIALKEKAVKAATDAKAITKKDDIKKEEIKEEKGGKNSK
jgi:large subunit ribosomal protein L22